VTKLQRRLTKLEALLTDRSGLVPHSRKWLEYWDCEIYNYMQDPEHRWPKVLFPCDAMTAVLQWSDPPSLVNSIPEMDEDIDAA